MQLCSYADVLMLADLALDCGADRLAAAVRERARPRHAPFYTACFTSVSRSATLETLTYSRANRMGNSWSQANWHYGGRSQTTSWWWVPADARCSQTRTNR